MTEEQTKKLHSPEYHLVAAQELLDNISGLNPLTTDPDVVASSIILAATSAQAHAAVASAKIEFRRLQREMKAWSSPS